MTSFHHIFVAATPISMVLVQKFSKSLPLSSYAFINTCLLHFLIDCVCFVLGSIVLEPFFEDFQDQAFEKSQLSFADQRGKLP
jgi:hypothetical protein